MILIDADDVICETNKAWLKEINNKYNTSYKTEDVKDWHLNCFNLEPEAFQIIGSYDFHFNLNIIEGAYPVLEKLWKSYKCRILTAAMHNGNIVEAKIKWFQTKLPFIHKDHLIFAKDKSVIGSKNDFLIDDAVHNHINHPSMSILYDQPWNRSWEIPKEKGYRVHSWDEIQNIFLGDDIG